MVNEFDKERFNIVEIMKRLPHSYPFLLVDRVLETEDGKKIKALKNVTINEPFFTGHFAEYPVMPGVLIIEALAQTAGLLNLIHLDELDHDELFFFTAIDKARFRRQVIPGDQLILEAELIKYAHGMGKFKVSAKVEDKIAADAEIMVAKRSFTNG